VTSHFVWDSHKELRNIQKHGVDFMTAAIAFQDPKRKIVVDAKHNAFEERMFCLGKIQERVLTVRFTYRNGKIRIIGAGFWRKGEKYYEKEESR
jgi:uncharacterized protein